MEDKDIMKLGGFEEDYQSEKKKDVIHCILSNMLNKTVSNNAGPFILNTNLICSSLNEYLNRISCNEIEPYWIYQPFSNHSKPPFSYNMSFYMNKWLKVNKDFIKFINNVNCKSKKILNE